MDNGQGLNKFLQKRKSALLNKWFEKILQTYPEETRPFLREKEKTFSNAIGSTLYEALQGLLAEIIHEKDERKIRKFLKEIIQLRAIQDLSPSQALSFLPTLKKIVKEDLVDNNLNISYFKDLEFLNSVIDDLIFLAFDIYMGFRENVFHLKIKELKKVSDNLLKNYMGR